VGGFGSGRPSGSGRDTVEASRSVDVNRLHREGCLRAGWAGGWQWTHDGERVAWISLRVDADRMHLTYRVCIGGADWKGVAETVRIVHIACRFGGSRPFFVCPGVVNGIGCGRRVVKLYGARTYFLCRHCYRLAYASQREDRYDRALRRANNIRMRLGGDRALMRASDPYQHTAKAALINVPGDVQDDAISDAIRATEEQTPEDRADLGDDQAMTEEALRILASPSASAYSRALAALRDDTRTWWEEQLSWNADDYEEDQTPYGPDAESLGRFLEAETLPWYEKRRQELGMKGRIGCHTFRATGITAYLGAGGTLENAQAMAAHESPCTTKLYDRTGDEITLDEVERITI
jgi:hypothetical protein